jgi:hypothetical protein
MSGEATGFRPEPLTSSLKVVHLCKSLPGLVADATRGKPSSGVDGTISKQSGPCLMGRLNMCRHASGGMAGVSGYSGTIWKGFGSGFRA